MKEKRQREILELIRNNDIYTQEELLARLREAGYEATQATISRDIRELEIIKTSAGNGSYKYIQLIKRGDDINENRLSTILSKAVESVDHAMNIVVVKSYTGMASAAGAAIDAMEIEGVVGSVAGDDTLILIARTEKDAERIHKELDLMV